jgi:hypothetical protein
MHEITRCPDHLLFCSWQLFFPPVSMGLCPHPVDTVN